MLHVPHAYHQASTTAHFVQKIIFYLVHNANQPALWNKTKYIYMQIPKVGLVNHAMKTAKLVLGQISINVTTVLLISISRPKVFGSRSQLNQHHITEMKLMNFAKAKVVSFAARHRYAQME